MLSVCRVVFAALGVLAGSAASAGPIVFEAEHANTLGAPFLIGEDESCANGLCVTLPDDVAESSRRSAKNAPVVYHVPVAKNGTYKFWFRVMWIDACGNSFLYRVDGGAPYCVAGSMYHRWCWVRGMENALDAGVHRIEIINREDGISIDQVALLDVGEAPPPGDATLQSNCVPRADSTPEFDIFFSLPHRQAASEDHPVLLSHKVPRVIEGESGARGMFLAPGMEAEVVLWIRNNHLKEAQGEVELVLPKGLLVKRVPGDNGMDFSVGKVPLRFPVLSVKDRPLSKLALSFACTEDLAPATHRVEVSLCCAGDVVCRKTVLLTRLFDWVIAGPFDGSDLDKSTYRVDALDAQAPWKKNVDGSEWLHPSPKQWLGAAGRLDLIRVLGKREHSSAIACTRVEAPLDGHYKFVVENDDRIRIWVNGKEAYTSTVCIPAGASRKVIDINLRAGVNLIVVKITQNKGKWEFKLTPVLDSPLRGVPFDE